MLLHTPPDPARKALRKSLRAARRALTPFQQKQAARGLLRQMRTCLPLLSSRRIAFYWPNDGEIDTRLLVDWLMSMGKTCYLPRLYPDGQNRVWFLRYQPGMSLQRNGMGLQEPPVRSPCCPPWALDVVLMPLVGFDRQGNRLGMGGGFYDRTFAFRKRAGCHRPLLIGVAHTLQEVPSIHVQGWDVPVDAIATDRKVLWLS
jgi:5-formyltetrahydrofolate cyclo-ligase